MTRLFVYGTLKRGHCRGHVLAREQFIGEAVTTKGYRLVDCGGYPGLIVSTSGHAIAGELWEVSQRTLRTIDEIEGVSVGLYERRPIIITCDGVNVTANTYFYLRPTAGLPDRGTSWSMSRER